MPNEMNTAIIFVMLAACHSLQSNSFYLSHINRTPAISKVRHRRNQEIWSCETYCPDSSLPRADSLNGCAPFVDYPPLIHHIWSDISFPSLSALIASETKLPNTYVCELIAFGAVYLSVPKIVSDNIIGEGKGVLNRATRVTKLSGSELRGEKSYGDISIGPTIPMTRVSRVLEVDTPVPKGSYCRVHVNPRRCREAAANVNWYQRFIYDSNPFANNGEHGNGLVFVDKIAGVPVSSTVDNVGENMAYQLQLLLPKDSPPLHLASRLDVCTSGVVPLAKNGNSARILSGAIAERTIEKTYLALCSTQVPTGILRHCFRRKSKSHENAKPTLLREYNSSLLLLESDYDNRTGKETRTRTSKVVNDFPSVREEHAKKMKTSPSNRSGTQPSFIWQLAELEILNCREVHVDELSADFLSTLERGRENKDANSISKPLFECEIRLITGRTHQIRLQFSAIGATLLGDSRYMPVEGLFDRTDEETQAGGKVVEEKINANKKSTRYMNTKPKRGNVNEDKNDFNSDISNTKKFTGDGAHLMGPEPKRYKPLHTYELSLGH